MTNRTIRELLNVIFLQQAVAISRLICWRFPRGAKHLLARAHETLRRAVTLEAPFHVQRVFAPGERHLADRAVTGDAADAFFDMNAVIEINIIRQIVDANPFDGFAVAKAFAHRLEHLRGGMDLRMARHAGVRRGNAGKVALFNRGVTVAAINAELAHVMAMAERHRLLAHDAGLGDIRRAFDDAKNPEQPADKKHRAKDADFGKSIGARMENLRHWTTLFGKKFSQEFGLRQKPTAAGTVLKIIKKSYFVKRWAIKI